MTHWRVLARAEISKAKYFCDKIVLLYSIYTYVCIYLITARHPRVRMSN